jgi:ubiquinone biosynthesis protein
MTPQGPRLAYEELKRYGHVVAVLSRYGFQDIIHRMNARHDVPWRDRMFKRGIRNIESLSTPQRVRLALEELGPTYVKFGQALCSRPDLLPDDYTREQSNLQDHVSSFPFHDARAIIEGQLGHPLRDLYDDFEKEPSAAGSLAQVYRARTKAGEDVAVKVQRPGIEEIIDTDIRILRKLATLAEHHLPEAAIYEPMAMIDEFATTIHQELDFVREGRNADRFRKSFEGDGTVHVPKVYWDLTATRVLTMEYVDGTKISDYARLDALGLDRVKIALNGANLILNEIFEVHRYHADPHAGNLFVLEHNVIAPVDFGMIGMLDQESVEQLRVLLTATVNKDVESLANIVLRLCGAGDPTHAGTLQLELEDLLERYYEVPLKQLNMKEIARDVTGILRRHKLHFPQRMAMITRSLMTLESVGCGLYPEFNVFEIMEPYARKLMFRKSDLVKRLRDLKNTVDETASLVNELPSDVRQILAKIKQNDITIKFEHRGLEHLSSVLDKSSNRLSFAVVIAALIVGSSLVLQTGVGPNAYGYPLLGLASLLIAGVLGLWLLIGIMRAGRL